MFGSNFVPGRKWTPHIEVSPDNVGTVPPGAFKVDPFSPTLAVDPFDPAAAIVIPTGRFVSIGFSGGRGTGRYRMEINDTGRTPLTLHDGWNLTPAGMSVNQMYKEMNEFMTDSNTVKFRKGFVAEVPYILSINNSYNGFGTLVSGDKLTGYYGSTTTTSVPSYLHRGKPVKWIAKRLYTATGAASTTVQLPAALYPGVTPRIVAAFSGSGGTQVQTGQSFTNGNYPDRLANNYTTLVYSSTWAMWYVTFGSAVTEVWYEYGQDANQCGGEVHRIQSIQDMINRDDFLKWVEYAPQDYLNFPPAQQRQNVTAVTQEAATLQASTTNIFRVANYPISIFHPVLVEVTNARIIDKDGNDSGATAYASAYYALPNSTMLDARQYFNGLYHSINPRTGIIDLGTNITPITGSAVTVRVTYSYITSPRDGAVLWGGGIIGLTDGRNVPSNINSGSTGTGYPTTDVYGNTVNLTPSTAAYGTPSWLNLTDVVGGLRLFVY